MAATTYHENHVSFGRDGQVRHRRSPVGLYERHKGEWTHDNEVRPKGLLVLLDDGTELAETYDNTMRRAVSESLRRRGLPSVEEQIVVVEAYLDDLAATAPEGAELHRGQDRNNWGGGPTDGWLKVTTPTATVHVYARFNEYGSWQSDPGVTAHGDTCYLDAEGTWRTYSRTGIEDSFYDDAGTKAATLIGEQLERAEQGRVKSKANVGKWVVVPGAPTRVHQDTLPSIRKKLLAGGSYSITPSGFGTGMHICGTRQRGMRSNPPVAKALGVPSAWTCSIDCD